MRKLLNKYKYMSLVVGALAVAMSGAGGVFAYKEAVAKKQIQKVQRVAAILHSSDMVRFLWDQVYNKMGYSTKQISHASYNEIEDLYNKTIASPTEENIRNYLKASESFHVHEKDNDHKDGSCCEACTQGLPCTGKDQKSQEG